MHKIDTGEVNASISVDDTVTFSDTVTKFSKSDVENALAQAQEQAKLLFDLERTMQLNKEYLAKVCLSHICLNMLIHEYSTSGSQAQRRRRRGIC